MPTTRSKPFRLPSLAAFTALSRTDRYAIFKRWIARHPDVAYEWYDTEGCVLALFGNAVTRRTDCHAGDVYFRTRDTYEYVTVLLRSQVGHEESVFRSSKTLGQLATRLRARR